jgi:lipopolysaccharide/colanic/teichoic acid biosynthesis glycosyltransferase
MSIVGTRPPLPDEVKQYSLTQRRRLSVKPGITGLWQTTGRSDTDHFDEIVKQDLSYIDKWSIWLDLRIIFKTVWIVLTAKGAR